MKRPDSTIKEPCVIGAIIDLGYCLSLLQSRHIVLLQTAYRVLENSMSVKGQPMPENRGGDDRFLRYLDCEVIQMLHAIRAQSEERSFDSVRGLFREGEHVYPNAGFRAGNHIQVCVRNPDCIKGYFWPVEPF
jgi:hypothetical protein